MARETVLDTFVTRYLFKVDRQSLDKLDSRVDNLRQKLSTASDVFKKVGAVGTGAFAAIMTETAQFEKVMTQRIALIGTSAEAIEESRGVMSELVDETGVSLKALAEAVFFIESAGFEGAESMELLGLSAKASAVGLGEMKQIADLLTSVIRAYGEDAESAAITTDQLIAAIREGKLDPQSLSAPLASVIPLAAELKVGFGELSAAMAAFSIGGIDASRSATALRGIFSKIIKPSSQGLKELEDAGLTIEGLREVVANQGIVSAINLIETEFEGDVNKIAKFFEDVEGLTGVLAVLKNTDRFEDIKTTIEGASGELDVALEATQDTISFKFGVMVSNFRDALVQIGEIMAPTTKAILDSVNSIIDSFQALPDSTKNVIANIVTMMPAILGLGLALQGLSFILGGFKILGVLSPMVGVLTGAFSLLTPAVVGLFSVLKAHPIIAVASAAVLLITNFEEIVGFFSSLWDRVRPYIENFDLLDMGFVSSAVALLITNFEEIVGFFSSLWGRVRPYIKNFDLLAMGFSSLAEEIAGFFSSLWGRVSQHIKDFGLLAMEFASLADSFAEEIVGFFSSLWDRVRPYVENFDLLAMEFASFAEKIKVALWNMMPEWMRNIVAPNRPKEEVIQTGAGVTRDMYAGARDQEDRHLPLAAPMEFEIDQPGVTTFPTEQPGVTTFPTEEPGATEFSVEQPPITTFPVEQPGVTEFPVEEPPPIATFPTEQPTIGTTLLDDLMDAGFSRAEALEEIALLEPQEPPQDVLSATGPTTQDVEQEPGETTLLDDLVGAGLQQNEDSEQIANLGITDPIQSQQVQAPPIGFTIQSPPSQIAGGVPSAGDKTVNNSFSINEINVNAEGGSPDEIAQGIDYAIRDQFQTTVEDLDTSIAR